MDINKTPYSNLKIFAHPDRLEAVKRGEMVAPLYVRIKPTNFCNHRCHYCHYSMGQYLELKGQEATNQIPEKIMYETIDSLGSMGVKAVTFSGGGEPLIYPYIENTMIKAMEGGMDLSIITNGHFLKKEKAEILKESKWVRISLDSSNPEAYAKTRGIKLDSFHEVCDNIKNFASIKNSRCELGINFVVNEKNYDQIFDTGKLMESLGVNHIKFAAMITNDTTSYHEPFKEKALEQIHRLIDEFSSKNFKIINLYETDFDSCVLFERSYSNCVIKNFVCVIAADSKVYYCHDKAYLENGIIGDLKNESFEKLWFSAENKEKFQKFDAKDSCKHHCVYDERNSILNSYLSLDENHINFI